MFDLKTCIGLLFFSIASIRCKENPSVIIIGAGAAGIAAASKLLENNITNIKILEAGSRIGGRIYSVNFEGSIIDLGGQWCHGEEGNVVYELVKDLNLLEDEVFQTQLIYSGEVLEKDFSNELYGIWDSVYASKTGNMSIGEYFTKRYRETVRKVYKDDERKLKIALEACTMFLSAIMSLEGTFSAFLPSASNDYRLAEGEQSLSWNGRGYKTILDVLMKKYPNPDDELPVIDAIDFHKKVVKITWNGNPNTFDKPVVVCSDDSEYTADYVVLTVSLGVLKDSYQTLFRPPLPVEKVNAIRELGIGAMSKIFLHFSNPWWSEDHVPFRQDFIWSEIDIEALSKSDYYWLLNFVSVNTVKGSPNAVAAWFAGEFVKDIENFSDNKLVDGIMYGLQKFLGSVYQNITEPDRIQWTQWYSNKNFKGTYSFQTPESRRRDVSGNLVLSLPLISNRNKPTLLFAGEAAHPYFYSTVHGAIETGQREAKRIIDLANN